jgi:general secretion pathway protein E
LQTGYKGRSGIYEMIEIDDHLAGMIHACESQSLIEAYCLTKGKNLRDDGIRKVISGETSLDEVIRVTRENL